MNKVKNRTIAALLFALLIVTGLFIYIGSYLKDGADWASFRANRTVYNSQGRLNTGLVLDRNGLELAGSEDGARTYNDDPRIRLATLHAVGDRDGNIGTAVLQKYAAELTGYNSLTGSYKLSSNEVRLQLTLDANVCAAAYKALDGRSGAVAVYDYEKGDILCLVSAPSFDPLDPPDLSESDEGYEGAYVNRCISSVYTPGSIFKIFTTAAALESIDGVMDMGFDCEGTYKVGADPVTCQGGTAHGHIGLPAAFAKSCNCTYAQIVLLLGSEKLKTYADMFGLTESMQIGKIATAAGKFELQSGSDVNVAWSGIGQSTDLVNPMTVLRAMGAIANKGVAVNPRLLLSDTSESSVMLSESTAEALRGLMANNVSSNYGADNYPGLQLCAKSGTAEVGGDAAPHAWFVGFIENESAPLAFVVLIENGGAGSKAAGAVANTVLQAAVSAYTQ